MKNILLKFCIFSIIAIISPIPACFAKKNRIVHFSSKYLKHTSKNGKEIDILKKNVVFFKKGLKITCDVAEYEEQKRIVAKGNVKVIKTREDKSKIEIEADEMIYYVDMELAEFLKGIKLKDGDNVLTSDIGEYNDGDDTANFYGNVKVKNPEQIFTSDILAYKTIDEDIRKKHFELFEDSENSFRFKRVLYKKNNAKIRKGTRSHKDNKIYLSEGKVNIFLKKDKTNMKSDFCAYLQKEEKLKLFGRPILKRIIRGDTFYIYSEKILIQKDKKSKDKSDKKVTAIGDVHLFNKELKAKSNKIMYIPSENKITFGINSIFWTKDSQLTANNAIMLTDKENLKKMYLHDQAFVIQYDEYKNYNQIRGDDIEMFFKDNKVYLMDITGNAQSIQYISSDKDSGLIGINHINCQRIKIALKNNKATKIVVLGKTYYEDLKGLMVAPNNINKQNIKLRGFNWRPKEKPIFAEVEKLLYNRTESSSSSK